MSQQPPMPGHSDDMDCCDGIAHFHYYSLVYRAALRQRRVPFFRPLDGAVELPIGEADEPTTLGPPCPSDADLRVQLEREQKALQAQLFQAQKLESIGTLAGAIAHDFNNLLAGIMADLALLELEQPDRLAGGEYLNDIKALAQRGADLTKQLLGFARRGKFEVVPLDFEQVLDSVCRMFERTHRDIKMRFHRALGSRSVMADRGQLEQVILNLLVNAQQAMPSGGELQVRSEEVWVNPHDAKAHFVQSGVYVRLAVIDQGIGMSDEVRVRIFEPFFTTRQSNGGTGLGLTSVFGIVKNHGGFVDVESTVGLGSSFYVYLPITATEPITLSVPARDIARNGIETLLLVDDEEQIVRSWGRTLRHLGYKVLVARNGIEAIELVRHHPNEISLVILDLIMPDMGGSETFEQLRKISPSLKVLLWSGYGSDGVAADLLARGCCGFIQKPSGIAALSAKLREVL